MKHRKNKSHTVIQYLITTVFFAKQAKKCLHFPGNLIESMLNCFCVADKCLRKRDVFFVCTDMVQVHDFSKSETCRGEKG